MAKEYVSRQLVDYLEHQNVEYVFGLCGHTNIAVLSELENSSIDFIDVRHEQIAAHAADGYARAKKKPSVVLSHLGPGLTNAATGVANAALDSIPMVVIAGDVPSHYYGKHPHQEVNMHADASQYEIYRPFVKRAWRVDRPDLFPEIIDKAFSLAQNGRPGPVLVSVPMDIFSDQIETDGFDKVKQNNKDLTKPSLSDAKARQVVERLLKTEDPVLYVGGGIMTADAAEELRTFANHLGIPVAYSLMGKGAVSDDHPLTLGMTGFWGTKFINETTRKADLILALGTRFSEADSSSWYPEYTFDIPNTKLIHIDIDPNELGRNFPVDLGIVADLKEALKELNRVAEEIVPEGRTNEKMRQAIASYRKDFFGEVKEKQKSDAFPLRPERILGDVRETLPEDAYITTDVGWNKNGVGQQFPAYKAGTILTPGGYATMGFGSSAAIGAKLADPERIVVSMIGDGGFGQNPSVMATAVAENIPVVWVVMNNSSYGTIAGLEKSHFDTTYGTVFLREGESYSPDFAKIAEGYGVESVKIKKAEDFKTALEQAIESNKPFLLDVEMQNEPVPTEGHWNIMDIYSPGQNITHSSV